MTIKEIVCDAVIIIGTAVQTVFFCIVVYAMHKGGWKRGCLRPREWDER